jgi:FkbM family methyltransferase
MYVERLDSILESKKIKVGLLKMDAQGFECKILEGMGGEVAEQIDVMKFEYADL